MPVSQVKLIPLEGQRFSRLLVLRRAANIGTATAYECICDCGAKRIVRAVSLTHGVTKSCGCFQSDYMAVKQKRHGYYGSPTYRSWRAMLARCRDSTHKQWMQYGGRGITVCDRWRQFENFLSDMGERPVGRSLDRINGNGNYEPGNCRWATRIEQRHNRRSDNVSSTANDNHVII